MGALRLEVEPRARTAPEPAHTVWGLDPLELHARFWASRGVQVVRPGEPSPLVRDAELYLLLDRDSLACFPLRDIAQQIAWTDADVVFVRVVSADQDAYSERVVTDDESRFLRFHRVYGAEGARLSRVTITPDATLAGLWQRCEGEADGRRRLRRSVSRTRRWACSVEGNVFDRTNPERTERFLQSLIESWVRPDATIDNIRTVCKGVWAHETAAVDPDAKFVGRAWIGAGRVISSETVVAGPASLWDDEVARPEPQAIRWLDLEPARPPNEPQARRLPALERAAKRLFDIMFALAVIVMTLPLYPVIMLLIMLEDGRPFFFAHRRETIGGREFPCLKFRSMRTDAEAIKAQLEQANQADGPQFFMEHDPRLTKIGAFLRKTQLDELPQFLNVLVGHMSVVGPRPSPFKENQYCPGWREARLSVRPGVTGLWQIMRTRAPGTDFQEWIRYDIEYVEKASLWLDAVIIYKTAAMVVRGVLRS